MSFILNTIIDSVTRNTEDVGSNPVTGRKEGLVI